MVHGAYVTPDARGKGAGKRAHKSRLVEMYSNLLYDVAIATVCTDNRPQMKIMEGVGWKRVSSFFSRRTGHHIAIFIKHLDEVSYA